MYHNTKSLRIIHIYVYNREYYFCGFLSIWPFEGNDTVIVEIAYIFWALIFIILYLWDIALDYKGCGPSLERFFFTPGLHQMKIAFLLLCGKAPDHCKAFLCIIVNSGEVILFLFMFDAIWQLVFMEETWNTIVSPLPVTVKEKYIGKIGRKFWRK